MSRRDSLIDTFGDDGQDVIVEHLLLEVCNFINEQTSSVFRDLLVYHLRKLGDKFVKELLDDVRDLDITLQYYEVRLSKFANEITKHNLLENLQKCLSELQHKDESQDTVYDNGDIVDLILNICRIVHKNPIEYKQIFVDKLQNIGFVEEMLEETYIFDTRTNHYGSQIQFVAHKIEAQHLVGKLQTVKQEMYELSEQLQHYKGDFTDTNVPAPLTITELPLVT